MDFRQAHKTKKIAVIGNYLPRQCGIATFTTNLCNTLAIEMKNDKDLIVVAMDDIPEGHDYPERVKFRVRANVQEDYYWAADFLNANQYEVAILQHEYGIFGGKDGSYILHMLKSLQMPILSNLHTVAEKPSHEQKVIINEIAKYSDRMMVMSQKAVDLLVNVYGVAEHQVCFVPHGIPDAPFAEPGLYNDIFGVKGRDVLLTFGLLSPGKGIENMIAAMPAIIEKHPNVVYIILGQTHPHVRQAAGDAYRHGLQQLVNKLGVQDNVLFHNHFVTNETLVQYLQTAMIYVIPYLQKEQITSGTLAYAAGVGTAIVSTPFWHAEELLADGRGRLVPFNDPDAMAVEIVKLLDNDEERNTMRTLAYQHGRTMTFKEVARKHLSLIAEVQEYRKHIPKRMAVARQNYKILDELPEINLSHFKNMTDDTGILQHARYNVPNLNHGYCVDDNARALIAASMYYMLRRDRTILPLLQKYLAFLHYSFNTDTGRFRNFMAYDRQWMEPFGSEDSHGRALWALGTAVKYAPNDGVRNTAMLLFLDGLPKVESFTFPRSWAFTIVGLHAYLDRYGGDSNARRLRTSLAEKLFDLFKQNSTDGWMWCEDTITYANAKLPHALILAGQWIPNAKMFAAGQSILEWLINKQTSGDGHLSIIGNSGWYSRGGEKANFDQQPIEAMGLIDACIDLCLATGDNKWMKEAERCLGWFIGRNDLNAQIYDFETGGCCDGLQPDGVNANQGAESTICWLISLLKMYEIMGLRDLVGRQ